MTLPPILEVLPDDQNIYPIDIPEIKIQPGLDMVLLELPGRYLPMMPNGLGVVHNILKSMGIPFQTLDVNIIAYHRYHQERALAPDTDAVMTSEDAVNDDPWDIVNTQNWNDPEFVEGFRSDIDELIGQLVQASPKIIGISMNGLNLGFAAEVIKGVRAQLPDVIMIGGGHEYAHVSSARLGLELFDYVFVYEADLTLEPIVRTLLAGERPADQAGVISRHDSPDWTFVPADAIRDLDQIDYPRYDWFDDLSIYRARNGYTLVPVTWSRGCRWSRCTFCAERFFWRSRAPEKILEELNWFRSKGFDLFHCNESDLIGCPDTLEAVCDEILRQGLKVRIAGQLRVHKRGTPELFAKMAQAGFVALRFGVDGWTERMLRLQMKGSKMSFVETSLKAAKAVGIRTTANLVIGVPGETEEDVQETIDNLIRLNPFLDGLENINTLILTSGGLYYEDPERFKIKFRGNKEEILKAHPKNIPDALWYSEDPHIDEEVRRERLKRVCLALYQHGIKVGPWAQFVVSQGLETDDLDTMMTEEFRTRYMENKWQSYEERASVNEQVVALIQRLQDETLGADEWIAECEPKLKALMGAHPNEPGPRRVLASIYIDRGDYPAAISQLDLAILNDDPRAQMHDDLALAYGSLRDFERAERAYHEACSIDEHDVGALQGLVLLDAYRTGGIDLCYRDFVLAQGAPTGLVGTLAQIRLEGKQVILSPKPSQAPVST